MEQDIYPVRRILTKLGDCNSLRLVLIGAY